jgi:FkbM family methyltransferase
MRNLHLKENLYMFVPERPFTSIADEDKVLLDFFEHKHKGYAIDIGAADGISINNCFKAFNTPYEWDGLSIEPNPRFHDQLKNIFEGTGVQVCTYAIHPTNSEVDFIQVLDEGSFMGHSNTVGKDKQMHHKVISVPAKSINDILVEFNVPNYIDFISMDIEGSEENVLKHWDFDKYKVKMWCIENGQYHEELLFEKGYKRYILEGYEMEHGNCFYFNNNI